MVISAAFGRDREPQLHAGGVVYRASRNQPGPTPRVRTGSTDSNRRSLVALRRLRSLVRIPSRVRTSSTHGRLAGIPMVHLVRQCRLLTLWRICSAGGSKGGASGLSGDDPSGEADPRGEVKTGVGAVQACLDGSFADGELVCDAPVGVAAADQFGDFGFAAAERL